MKKYCNKPVHIRQSLKIVMKNLKQKVKKPKVIKMIKENSKYISPNELAHHWQCSRSSVNRIARRAKLTQLCLGEGKNGTIRYMRKEVEAYEKTRQTRLTA